MLTPFLEKREIPSELQFYWCCYKVNLLVDSRLGFSPLTPSEESVVIPLVGGKHVGAVVDTQNRHLLGVVQVLQQLKKQKLRRKKNTSSQGPCKRVVSDTVHSQFWGDIRPYIYKTNSAEHTGTLGVIKKYWDVVSLQAVRTTMSKTRLSFVGSIPYKEKSHGHA